MKKITPHLWFDTQALEAANYYVSVFPNSKITHSSVLKDTPSGDTDVVSFELNGEPFMAISAGPLFKFNEAISLLVPCDSQEEIDYYWSRLSAEPQAEQCGWCKDKFGVSWQVSSSAMMQMMSEGSPEQIARVTQTFLAMKKIDLGKIQAAYDGK